MALLNITQDNFDSTVSSGIVLVDFWAAWCGPCRMFGPIFEAAAEQNSDITFAKLDTEANQELSSALGIMSIPTLMAFRDGILLFNQPGALPAEALDELISQLRSVNMSEVRAEVARQAAQETAE